MNNSGELYDRFRSDIVDTAKPYLWSDDEVWGYADAAYRMFVRLTGGIADFTSDVTQVDVVTGEDVIDMSPSILRIMSASLESTGRDVRIINSTDIPSITDPGSDYGYVWSGLRKNVPGAVKCLVIGMQRAKGKLINIPVADDVLNLHVYRLPLVNIVDETHDLCDIEEDHHIYLLDWMKHLAYKKQDAETFNKTRSEEAEVVFRRYCDLCTAEWERRKHKTRVVQYGGL